MSGTSKGIMDWRGKGNISINPLNMYPVSLLIIHHNSARYLLLQGNSTTYLLRVHILYVSDVGYYSNHSTKSVLHLLVDTKNVSQTMPKIFLCKFCMISLLCWCHSNVMCVGLQSTIVSIRSYSGSCPWSFFLVHTVIYYLNVYFVVCYL